MVFKFLSFHIISALKQRFTKSFFKFVKSLPIIRGKIAKEVDKNAKGIEDGFNKGVGKLPYVHKLPEKGLTGVGESGKRKFVASLPVRLDIW